MNLSFSAWDFRAPPALEVDDEAAEEAGGVEPSAPHPNVAAASVAPPPPPPTPRLAELKALARRLKPPAPIISATPFMREPGFGRAEVDAAVVLASESEEEEEEDLGRRTGMVRVPRRSPATTESGTATPEERESTDGTLRGKEGREERSCFHR